MDLVEAIIAVLMAIAGLIGLLTVFGRYMLGRMREQDADNKRRIQDLEDEVARLRIDAAKVPELLRQVEILTDTLHSTQKRLDEAEARAERKQAENEAHLEQIAERDKRIRSLERACDDHQLRIQAYERVFELQGTKLAAEPKAGNDEPPETNERAESRASGEGEIADGPHTQ